MTATKDYGKLIPKKIVRADGRIVTYWISPEQADIGKKIAYLSLMIPRK
jgi:hypothetical protein